jgi:ubiquinone/menaquinone biosynthesis C-methylase UbiE
MGENSYFIEDTESELARLLFQDNGYNLVLNLLPDGFMPTNKTRILDLACGPGGWALQVSHDYPETSVVGVDINEQMIAYARAQAEVRELLTQFSIMDALKVPWEFPDKQFSLINARFTTGFTPVSFLPALCQECWRTLQPDGVFRYIEGSFASVPRSAATQKLSLLTCEALYRGGLIASPFETGMAPIIAQILKKIGFSVAITPYVIDLSAGEPMHRIIKENWLISIGLVKPFIVRTGAALPEEIDSLQQELARDWNEQDFCGYYYLCSLTAKKLKA